MELLLGCSPCLQLQMDWLCLPILPVRGEVPLPLKGLCVPHIESFHRAEDNQALKEPAPMLSLLSFAFSSPVPSDLFHLFHMPLVWFGLDIMSCCEAKHHGNEVLHEGSWNIL